LEGDQPTITPVFHRWRQLLDVLIVSESLLHMGVRDLNCSLLLRQRRTATGSQGSGEDNSRALGPGGAQAAIPSNWSRASRA
jgi:hypothetical protein